jgi:OOP family OmpA-OmpF porin
MRSTRGLSMETKMKTKAFRQTLSLSACTTLALAVTLPASADDLSGWYVGGSAGQSQANIAKKEIVADLLTGGLVTTSFKKDETDLGFKLLAGYRWNRYFSLEGGYFDLGEFSYKATTNPAGSKKGELEFSGWNLDLVGMAPVSERSALFARIGAHRGEADVTFTDSGAVATIDPRSSKTDTNYKAGVGYQFNVTDALALRVEAERYRMNDAVGNKGDLDLISAGFVYYFTNRQSTTSEKPLPAKAPNVVVVPLPAGTEEYCTLLDIQFEIAQEKIERGEQEKLAVVATFLNRYPKTSAVIEGHSDNVGSTERNLELSQGRAESVKEYLIDKHRIERRRLTAIGYGETRPIQSNDTEAGKRANRRIATIIGCATDIAGLEPLPARMTLALHIEFDTDDATVKPMYRDELRKVAGFMKANPRITATMEGHADNTTPDTAQSISRQRAQSIATYLEKEFGVARSRMTVQGYGATRRFAYNTSAEGQQENRRVNIILDYRD